MLRLTKGLAQLLQPTSRPLQDFEYKTLGVFVLLTCVSSLTLCAKQALFWFYDKQKETC
ncbi:hypothetical protein SORDD21_01607 [Streptococcus oralis]|uniref:Uncharacterized protein n=1 Tax=Streptococcus oralis TaxID=1303 RepID=A0A139PIU8_STROR|nr:hypothetical protein SORDD21_01607 [Streptococcus oralis]